jgi:hypothetical protein
VKPSSQQRQRPLPSGTVLPVFVGLARRRRVATAMLALFLSGLVLSTAGEVLTSHVDLAQGVRIADWPSHDSDGDPCGPDCTCFCCPGRGPIVVLPLRDAALALAPSSDLAASPLSALHPQEIDQRIFHPPRA